MHVNFESKQKLIKREGSHITVKYETYTGNGNRGPTAPLKIGFGDPDDRLRQEEPYEPVGLLMSPDGERVFRLARFDPNISVMKLIENSAGRKVAEIIFRNN